MQGTQGAVIAGVVAAAFAVGLATTESVPSASAAALPVVTGLSAVAVVPAGTPAPHSGIGARGISTSALNAAVQRYCGQCHNPRQTRGNLSLAGYDVDSAADRPDVSEKVIRKLRADMMPPPGSRRPTGDTLLALVETLERVIDKSARPNPGTRVFQRMNRPEYERAVRDLLGVQINAGDYLPLDTKSANFDNIADVQSLSPTLLEAYLNAASAVSRIAIGDRSAASLTALYTASPFASQHPWDHVTGSPYGTRGGIVASHPFPADGEYQFRIDVRGGVGVRLDDIDISVAGQRVALLKYERGMDRSIASADAPQGSDFVRTEPIFIKAGQQRVSVAFIRRGEGPYEDLVKPLDWSLASNGTASAGTTAPAHIMELAVVGPQKVTGISDTPSRTIVFACRPANQAAALPCAEQIITRLATRAYRRPLTGHDKAGLIGFYKQGEAAGGFEEGVRVAIQAMLASPHFVFRFEEAPRNIAAGTDYKISDTDLATRLSFFLWGTIPDEQLLGLGMQNRLSQPGVLEAQVKRMLADKRAEALSSRFAAQWLRLQDIEKVRPDAFWFPDYDQQLADAMYKETELFFQDVVRNNRNVLDLFTADYTYVNERLARHYGIPNVSGPEFRKVTYPDATRRGLLGQGSMLVQTSLANRTSPVLRGKWVMEVLIGMPPPPPPPNVPTLEETAESKGGRMLTTRERMEIHRANPTCKSCHQYMDPIGLALDNFDVTGKWRSRENGAPLDTRGTMYDGMPVESPSDLLKSLMARPIPLLRAYTENLMAYAVGRRVEDYDQPTIRTIVADAAKGGYRMSSFIMGVVKSPAFRTMRAEPVADAGQH
ncbi:MAG: DUF1592 domain-containing protein [Gemmatimonadota bacterium]